MLEYPSMINTSKSPRDECIAFEKLDGSNFRAKWTNKRGFDLFGTRTQLIDEKTEFWSRGIEYFQENLSKPLDEYFRKNPNLRNEREIIVFGEFFGPNSFAGVHDKTEKQKIVVFDILVGHKNRYFVKPHDFVKEYSSIIEIPRVIYEGNLSDEFIQDVRKGKYDVEEGVICKGRLTSGAFRGKVWMCKIKTQAYLDKIFGLYGEDGLNKYGE